ncbi:MAG: hypothetical protein GY854_26965 [Deltaproteobacteria bacterium]|nr:hypothetical protein [Deltaproteobacteria bacterium]
MTEDETRWCAKLAECCDLTRATDFDLYLECIAELKASKDPSILRHMLRCLRDTDAGEIQYELVEACESYPVEMYLDMLLDEGEEMSRVSAMWFQLMFQSVLNSQQCRALAVERIRQFPDPGRQFYAAYIKEISLESPKYEAALDEIEMR